MPCSKIQMGKMISCLGHLIDLKHQLWNRFCVMRYLKKNPWSQKLCWWEASVFDSSLLSMQKKKWIHTTEDASPVIYLKYAGKAAVWIHSLLGTRFPLTFLSETLGKATLMIQTWKELDKSNSWYSLGSQTNLATCLLFSRPPNLLR